MTGSTAVRATPIAEFFDRAHDTVGARLSELDRKELLQRNPQALAVLLTETFSLRTVSLGEVDIKPADEPENFLCRCRLESTGELNATANALRLSLEHESGEFAYRDFVATGLGDADGRPCIVFDCPREALAAVSPRIDELRQLIKARTRAIDVSWAEFYRRVVTTIVQRQRELDDPTASRLQAATETTVADPLRRRGKPKTIRIAAESAAYRLSEEDFEAITGTLRDLMGHFRRCAAAYRKLETRDLRKIVLDILRNAFRWESTSDSFHARGNAAITASVREETVFIARLSHPSDTRKTAALDAVLRRLEEERARAVVINFSRRGGFSEVVESAMGAVADHPTTAGSVESLSPSEFRSQHRLPESGRLVSVLHLLVDLGQ